MPKLLSDTHPRTVLVLDADQASALAIVRSLGRHGIPVHVASDLPRPLAGHSRHAQAVLRYPDPLRCGPDFVAWLATQLQDDRFGLVIPVTERTVVPLLRQRAQLDDRRIAMAPSVALEQVLDKGRTLKLARSLGIPVPRSITVHALDELPAASANIGFPVVVKPARSVGHDAVRSVQLSVSYAHGATELEALVRHALRFGAVILQEFFRGQGVGIELIADHGTVRHAFQHRRLHEVPLTGGGSSLRVSEAIVPALRGASEQLMQALSWHGVAMVEFKYEPVSAEFRLMEINGRFWGSLPLAIAAGADFPVMLHELLTTGQVAVHAPPRPGVLCRQLARDLDWLEHVLRRAAPPQLVRLPSLREVLRDSLLVFSPRHHFDVQSLRDPKPGLVDLWQIARRQWQRITLAIRQRRRLATARQAAALPHGEGRRRLARAQHVLFLCHGNINRSALAQACAEVRYPGRFSVASAGFHQPGGRPADGMMVEVAGACGIDLAHWQSSSLSAAQIERADVIFVMELTHMDRLVNEYPGAAGKAFLLGAANATSLRDTEVPDPYGQARSRYEQVCRQVLAAVDAWFGAVPAAVHGVAQTNLLHPEPRT